jgi:hypothetical protein
MPVTPPPCGTRAAGLLCGRASAARSSRTPRPAAHGRGHGPAALRRPSPRPLRAVHFAAREIALPIRIHDADAYPPRIYLSTQGTDTWSLLCQCSRGYWDQSIRRRRGRCPSDCSKEEGASVTQHGFILETWTEADIRPVVELHADRDLLAARLGEITLEDASAGPRVRSRLQSQDRSWTAKSELDLGQVQRSLAIASRQVMCRRRATLSEFCVGLRLDRRGCSFPQSTAEIGSDQQAMTACCDVGDISLRISAGQS